MSNVLAAIAVGLAVLIGVAAAVQAPTASQEPAYRREDFVRDLKAGLPVLEPKALEEPPPSCLNCVHLKKAGGDTKLVLMKGDSVIAEGPGKGVYWRHD